MARKKKTYPLRLCLPTLLALFFVLISILPISFTPSDFIYVPWVMPVIYYFAIFRPSVLNVFSVFLLGIIADLLMQTPFGLNTFFFVLLFFIANLSRRFLMNVNFQGLWGIFALIMAGMYAAWYLATCLIQGRFVFGTFFIEYILLVLFCPLIMALSAWLNAKMGAEA